MARTVGIGLQDFGDVIKKIAISEAPSTNLSPPQMSIASPPRVQIQALAIPIDGEPEEADDEPEEGAVDLEVGAGSRDGALARLKV